MFFFAWVASIPAPFFPIAKCGDPMLPCVGWSALAKLEVEKRCFIKLVHLESLAFESIRLLQYASRADLLADRLAHYESVDGSSQIAAANGDMRTAFKVVKKLSGFSVRGPQVVR